MKKISIKKQGIIKFLKISSITLVSIIILFCLFDWFIMPIYTRHWNAVDVPNVTHLSFDAAKKILNKAGLEAVKGSEKFDENYPPGFVLFQNPEASFSVKKGRRIYLTIGKGQRTFEMPKLVGISERDAKFVLAQNNLKVGQITYESDDFYPEGVVSEQSVKENHLVAVREKISLTVSLGGEPTEFIVPDIIGKSKDDAVVRIIKAGLTLGEIKFQATNKLLPNTVIDQSLEAGLDVQKGDTLAIIVSKLPQLKEDEIKW